MEHEEERAFLLVLLDKLADPIFEFMFVHVDALPEVVVLTVKEDGHQ